MQDLVQLTDKQYYDSSWKLYKARLLYETDDLEKAEIKRKLAEITSDLNSDVENDGSMCDRIIFDNNSTKRVVKKPTRFVIDSDEDEEPNIRGNAPKCDLIIKLSEKRCMRYKKFGLLGGKARAEVDYLLTTSNFTSPNTNTVNNETVTLIIVAIRCSQDT
ncbi:hypothetical protein RN001_005944 [Aquatica leii]|uniref:Uncharacterized protein n=1 Tax=Aquatica leii TaxID=1421715 RepID=A0AAN7P783_9COLE|nr:hypothetical protein RN001_005944 [Aquatica leii]